VAAWSSLKSLETPAAFRAGCAASSVTAPIACYAAGCWRWRRSTRRPRSRRWARPAGDRRAGRARRRRARRRRRAAADLREVTLLHYVHERSHARSRPSSASPPHHQQRHARRARAAQAEDADHGQGRAARAPSAEDFPARVGRVVAADGPRRGGALRRRRDCRRFTRH
jgi:hypothetical protein